MSRPTLAEEMRRLVGATIAVWFPESMAAEAIFSTSLWRSPGVPWV